LDHDPFQANPQQVVGSRRASTKSHGSIGETKNADANGQMIRQKHLRARRRQEKQEILSNETHFFRILRRLHRYDPSLDAKAKPFAPAMMFGSGDREFLYRPIKTCY